MHCATCDVKNSSAFRLRRVSPTAADNVKGHLFGVHALLLPFSGLYRHAPRCSEDQILSNGMPSSSSYPKAKLRFCHIDQPMFLLHVASRSPACTVSQHP